MQRWISMAAASLALTACGGGGDVAAPPIQRLGTLRVGLTDAPACGYDKVFITVTKVRVHQSSTAAETDGGWTDINLAAPMRVDLLTLTNGVLAHLGQTALPAGNYQQMRLVLDGSANANTVVPTGGTETALETPSGLQSGLKMNANITVAADQVADVAIDFDACKSVVKAGNSGRYLLKPVLSVIPQFGDAGMRVTGYVDAGLAAGKATVSLQLNGVPVRSTPSDADGRFVLYPVPAGTYDLVIRGDGRAVAVMTGVPVTTAAITNLGSTTLRLMPPDSLTSATLSGTVMVNGALGGTGAETRLTQTLSGGPTVEIGKAPVDAVTGAYSYTVPLGMPVKLAYDAAATSFVFAGQVGDAGKVRITAMAPTFVDKSVDLTLLGSTTQNFVFP